MRFLLRRLNIYGDFWLRYLYWGARNCPPFVEPAVVAGISGMFLLLLAAMRRAIVSNMRAIIPGLGAPGALRCAFRVFWNYAWALSDLAHVRGGEDILSWEIAGKKNLDELIESPGGAIILTAHMGNYDIAAPVFAGRFRKPIHMVRAPERVAEARQYQDAHRSREQSAAFVIHYNEPGNMLGVELAKCLEEGDIVAVQGDRILFDVSAVELAFDHRHVWSLPRGPFLLASVAKARLYPLFILKMGHRRYRIESYPALEMSYQNREEKKKALDQIAMAWSQLLARVIRKHWHQWFVFEPTLQARPDTVSPANDPLPEVDNLKVDLALGPSPTRSKTRYFWISGFLAAWWWAEVLNGALHLIRPSAWVIPLAILVSPVMVLLALVAFVKSAILLAWLLPGSRQGMSPRLSHIRNSGVLLFLFSLVATANVRQGDAVNLILGATWLLILGATLIAMITDRAPWPGDNKVTLS